MSMFKKFNQWFYSKYYWTAYDAYPSAFMVLVRRILGCRHENAMDLGDEDRQYWFCYSCERKLNIYGK